MNSYIKDYIRQKIRQNGLKMALLLVAFFVVADVAMVIYYRNVINQSSKTNVHIQNIRDGLSLMDLNIRLADMGVRAYIIKSTDQFLQPYIDAKTDYINNLDNLEKELKFVGYDVKKMAPARKAIVDYMQVIQLMVDLVKEGRKDEAIAIFEEDRGDEAWAGFYPFVVDATEYIDNLWNESEAAYKGAINSILFIQILLIVFSLPIFVLVYRKIGKDEIFKQKMFSLIDESNRKYLYDDGKEIDVQDEDAITENLVGNLKKAAGFINSITNGRYNVEWEGMDKKLEKINKDNIAGELIMMRDQMKKAKREDEIRAWTNEGLSKFAELIRKHEDDLYTLADKLIANIVDYLDAQQGGLFLLNETNEQDEYLELLGCYAYQRKKFLEKRIEPGQGMVGQCFLEGETTYVTNLPQEYVNITSGLGETNPKALLVVPLRINENVVGVIEIAGLKEFEDHQIRFVERLAEIIASAISNVKTNAMTRVLLEQSQQQTEEMRAQEEEMRQNMEELQATQEQTHRKNEEIERLLKEASENEEKMKMQLEMLEELKEEAAKAAAKIEKEATDYRDMLMEILNEIPQKVFLKDAEGKMYIANKKVAEVHGIPLSELIGKSDYDFVDKETADEWRKQELEIMKKGEERYVFEDKIGGKTRVLETIKKVFRIRPLNQDGLLGIQTDITERIMLEKKVEELQKKKE